MASDLDLKLSNFKIKPLTKEQALKNIRKMRSDLGIEGMKVDKKELQKILKRAGSLCEEILELRRQERA